MNAGSEPLRPGGTGHLKARGVSVTFGQVRALRGITLEARPGEVVAILGANGSGKTTFLKAVAGLVPVSSGRITCNGLDITRLPAHERVSRGVHYVSDRARVALRMTVRENLAVGGYLRNPAQGREAMKKVCDLFPVLGEKAPMPAGILSGGERQMLVIGRALMGNPSLLLFDEPFLGLSLEVRERILPVIDGELRGRATILLAEHDLGSAFRILDRYCIFRDGGLIHEGGRSEVPTEERLRAAFRRFHGQATGESPGRESR